MIKLDVRIMAHPSRREGVLRILNDLGMDESIVVYDDRPHGGNPFYTARKTWGFPLPSGATHRLVLQDDAVLCKDFLQQVARAIEHFPDAVWSLWMKELTPKHQKGSSPYVRISGGTVYGVGVVMPVHLIDEVFKWSTFVLGEDYTHDDNAIGQYCKFHAIPIMTTIPGLIQHGAPTESIVNRTHNSPKKVSRVYQYDAPKDFDNTDYGFVRIVSKCFESNPVKESEAIRRAEIYKALRASQC